MQKAQLKLKRLFRFAFDNPKQLVNPFHQLENSYICSINFNSNSI